MSDKKQWGYVTFMRGMYDAPRDYDKCEHCGGTGFVAVMCCNGSDCGCNGLPHDFEDCPNKCDKLTDEQIEDIAFKYEVKNNLV